MTMGCIYSIYLVEDRKLIAILNECNVTNKKKFILMREALKFKKGHILTKSGDRNLTVQTLMELHTIINGDFYYRINTFSYVTRIWHYEKPTTYSDCELEKLIYLYNTFCINETNFLEEIKNFLLFGCILTTKILFIKKMAKKKRRKRKQRRGFLSRYDFAYAGRDSVNQAAYHVNKIAPRLLKAGSKKIDAIAARRIAQITNSTANEIQRIAPGIIMGAIEEVYKTPFRLFGKIGINKYNQIKKKLITALRHRKKHRKK